MPSEFKTYLIFLLSHLSLSTKQDRKSDFVLLRAVVRFVEDCPSDRANKLVLAALQKECF